MVGLLSACADDSSANRAAGNADRPTAATHQAGTPVPTIRASNIPADVKVGDVLIIDPESGSLMESDQLPLQLRNGRVGLYVLGLTTPDPVKLASAFCDDADGAAIGTVAANNKLIDPSDRLDLAGVQQLSADDVNPIVLRSKILGKSVDLELNFNHLGTLEVCLESVVASDPSLQQYVGPDPS